MAPPVVRPLTKQPLRDAFRALDGPIDEMGHPIIDEEGRPVLYGLQADRYIMDKQTWDDIVAWSAEESNERTKTLSAASVEQRDKSAPAKKPRRNVSKNTRSKRRLPRRK